jgi:hypothetical protein
MDAMRDFLHISRWRKALGFFRRMSWRLCDWWRGPIRQFEVGDVIEYGGQEATIEKIDGRTMRLSNGSTLTI